MRFSTLRYYFTSAIESIVKNKLMSVASIITVASCTVVFILSFVIASNLDYILSKVETSIAFSVFLDESTTKKETDDIHKELLKIEHVKEVEFVTKEDALQKMEGWFGESNEIISGFEEDNPFPNSFDVYLESAEYQSGALKIVQELKNYHPQITNVKSEDMEVFVNINKGVRTGSIIIIAIMAVISIVIIINTIKLTVNNRSREINIMKYVGATDWFIRWPFIIEGMLIGLIGAVIPLLISYLLYQNVAPNLEVNFYSMKSFLEYLKPTRDIFKILIPFSLSFGVFIGLFGSSISVRRYLKV